MIVLVRETHIAFGEGEVEKILLILNKPDHKHGAKLRDHEVA